jgi:HEAT repeat protein
MKIAEAGPLVAPLIKNPKVATRETSTLALGMLGWEKGVPILKNLIENRRMERGMRVFAALALGISNVQSAGPLLVEVMERDRGKKGEDVEVQCAACLALGIMKYQDGLPNIIRLIRTPQCHQQLRATAVTALAKYGRQTVMTDEGEISVTSVIGNLLRSDPSVDVRRSAILALGGVWYRGVAQSLLQVHKRDADGWVRALSLLVLAENAKDPVEKKMAQGLFRRLLEESRDRGLRDVAMLAAGISGDKTALPLIRPIFKKEKYAPSWSASVLSLGFLKDEESIPHLLQVLSTGASAYKKAYVCMAIALMEKGDKRISDALKGILVGKTHPHLRAMASMALARIGDRTAVPMLLDLLPRAKNPYFCKMTAMSIGYFRDLGAFTGLKEFFESKKADNETRSGILVAVGCMGDRSEIPILRKISLHYNFLLPFQKIYEVFYDIM